MRFDLRIFIVFILVLSPLNGRDFEIKDIPIQDGGRIQPFDTYARNQLLAFYGKRSIKHEKLSAIDWIFDLVLNPVQGESKKVFNIRNPEVVVSLKLDWTSDHKYSYSELTPGLQDQFELINDIYNKPDELRNLFEQQLMEIYFNVLRFREISQSLSCLIPVVQINDTSIANHLGVSLGSKISYYYFVKHGYAVNDLMLTLLDTPKIGWSHKQIELANVLNTLNQVEQNNFAQSLKLIPPEPFDSTGIWRSPWEVMHGKIFESSNKKILNTLENYLTARIHKDESKMISALSDYLIAVESTAQWKPNIDKLKLETWVNESNLFYKSVAFYLLAFIFLGLSWMTQPKWMQRISSILLIAGLLYHTIGIYLRMVIMSRPPVSTLYETVIFVGFITVVFAIVIEYFRRDGLGLFIGAVSGSVLHYIGFGYAADGDTLEMLVAVLNSNFWLATHVTTITLGYGTSLVAGFIGHLYLIHMIRKPENKTLLKSINKNMFGATLIALFFTLFGTILGGIWADQSWGRFWGWDPKENGALLIVLWHLMMIHMRLTAMVKPEGFALGMVMNNIVVVIAWFGVNLLNVGLHSYGFTSGVALNIALFIALELITGFGTYYLAKYRKKSITSPNSS